MNLVNVKILVTLEKQIQRITEAKLEQIENTIMQDNTAKTIIEVRINISGMHMVGISSTKG